jgi:hypothetical protein
MNNAQDDDGMINNAQDDDGVMNNAQVKLQP